MSSFWLILKQQWTIEEISIFSNSSHLEWREGLSDTILKGTHPGTIPARFGLIWFSGFRGEDLNVIFYQNLPNLHNQYKSAERKISQKNPEYMLIRVITKLPNSEQSYKGKVKTHKYINRQNQSTTGTLWKP